MEILVDACGEATQSVDVAGQDQGAGVEYDCATGVGLQVPDGRLEHPFVEAISLFGGGVMPRGEQDTLECGFVEMDSRQCHSKFARQAGLPGERVTSQGNDHQDSWRDQTSIPLRAVG
ncbi:hypothetical protein ABT160_28435 [Streptomyces sp. NPDC001941]|uniref:hypothetical protein n=1 Tax=Streptomyces sp. NPDC001941 TaxID=3154659 RepID=UPI00332D0088